MRRGTDTVRCSDIGVIAPGKQADIAFYKLDELRFSGAGDPLAALVLCGAHAADRVMIKGEWRVVDGAPIGVDVARLRAQHGRPPNALSNDTIGLVPPLPLGKGPIHDRQRQEQAVRQISQGRDDLAEILNEIRFVREQVGQLPMGADVWRNALLGDVETASVVGRAERSSRDR
jgi:hypothetical protein